MACGATSADRSRWRKTPRLARRPRVADTSLSSTLRRQCMEYTARSPKFTFAAVAHKVIFLPVSYAPASAKQDCSDPCCARDKQTSASQSGRTNVPRSSTALSNALNNKIDTWESKDERSLHQVHTSAGRYRRRRDPCFPSLHRPSPSLGPAAISSVTLLRPIH